MKHAKVLLTVLAVLGVILGPDDALMQEYLEDVVYLKDGSIIRGIIREHVPGSNVKIEIVGGNIFAFGYDEILKLTREPPVVRPENQSTVSERSTSPHNVPPVSGSSQADAITFSEKPLFRQISRIGVQFAEGEAIFTVGGISSFRLNQWVSLGAGLEFNHYPYAEVLPIFGNLWITWMPYSSITPFTYFDVGYSFAVDTPLDGGLLLGFGGGVDFLLSPRISCNIGACYRSQWSTAYELSWDFDPFDPWDYYYYEEFDVRFDQFGILGGFSFFFS
jgi:hypothetical protein